MAAVDFSPLQRDQWADPRWRLHNIYWIIDEGGIPVPFRPNEEQDEFLRDLWYLNVILKARQIGFTTMIDLLILDQCFFVPNTTAGIVAHNLDDATKIFRNKIKYPHSKLPESLRRANPLVKESESEFVWKNGSSVSVGTSMRSGTLQYLHISELGKIARKFPEKAREIRTGALNAVHEGHYVFVESTAEGRGGDFYELVQIAKKLRESRGKLTTLDFKLHFYPWWKKASYSIDASGVTLTKEDREYFDRLEQEHGVKLTANQKAWYVKKAAVQKGDIRQEYPSHEDEAFEAANEEKYWLKVMLELRRKERIRDIPIIPDRPVNLMLDIGNDMTSIWFHQFIAGEHRLIDFYQNSGEELAHYLVKLQRLPYLYGGILLPHDAKDTGLASHDPSLTVFGRVKKAFPNCQVKVVPRTPNKLESIDRARSFLRGCWFHDSNAATGIACMENYRKQWNEITGMWRDEPFHDKYSHGSDAFMQLSDGWSLIADADFNPGKVFKGQFGRVGDREVNY